MYFSLRFKILVHKSISVDGTPENNLNISEVNEDTVNS